MIAEHARSSLYVGLAKRSCCLGAYNKQAIHPKVLEAYHQQEAIERKKAVDDREGNKLVEQDSLRYSEGRKYACREFFWDRLTALYKWYRIIFVKSPSSRHMQILLDEPEERQEIQKIQNQENHK